MRRPLSGLMSIGRRSTWSRRPQGAGRARSVRTPHRVLGCGLLAVSLLVCLVGLRYSGALTTSSGDPGVHPAGPPLGPESQGGPDNCGWYEFVDSDPPDPVIEFRYVSLDTLPCDTIEGLGDDNVVGPYPIGFDFPYYWYPAASFYVGSNGYISFSDDWLEAASFVQYPNTHRPNDVLGIFTDDLLFGPSAPQALCRYYTNAVDTCIIEYRDVPFWDIPAPTGNNTFEIVLCGSDSSITYQYLEQTGFGSDTRSVGWESIGAACGFSYLFGSTPPDHDIHDSLAVRIYVPSVPPFEYHDLAVVAAREEENRGFFVEVLEEIPLWARVANHGSLPEVDVPVRLTVQDGIGQTVFTEVEALPFIGSWEETTIDFGTWTAMSAGIHTITAGHLLVDDMYPVDDSVVVECNVIQLPATLGYVDETIEQGCIWSPVEAGWANYFEPTRDSAKITEVSVYIGCGSSPCSDCLVLSIHEDTAPGGGPGEILWADTLDYLGIYQYYTAEVSPPYQITDGSGFWVSFFRTTPDVPYPGFDLTPPYSRRPWCAWTPGEWVPDRDADHHDLPVTCRVEPWVLPPAMVTIDPFQRETAQGGSFDFAVRFRNPGDAPASTRWWIDVYRGETKVYHLPYGNTWSLSLSSQSEIEKIYGLPVPPGALPDEYTLFVSVGPDTLDPVHQDSVPVLVRSRGEQ